MMKTKTKLTARAWRSRWAAIGAAIAVSLGAGGVLMVNAASTAPSSFVGITPVRILDTRTDVGLPGPFASGVAQKLQVTGSVPTQPPNSAPAANAVAVPATAIAVVMNVTVIGPSSAGFISIRPGDATGTPATSNINWGASGPNIANSVTVQLPSNGTIDIYVQGAVREVLVDVAGYYTPATTSTPVNGVTLLPFEVRMSYGSTQTIAENGDLHLSLRCREDDLTPDQDFPAETSNNMQFRAYSTGKYMTTYVDSTDLYSNEGVTIARALGASGTGTKVQTTFVTRDSVRSAASMTAADGRQISVDGDSVQVMFNVTDPAVTGGGTVDCYARGYLALLPAR